MSKKGIINIVKEGAKKHAPEILVGTGIVGMTTAAVMAVKATPKAMELLEDEKANLGTTYLTKKEMIQAGWKPYIPSVALGAISAACIIAGTACNAKRSAALATVYAISENTLKRYQDEVVKAVGKEKADEIRKEVVKARIKDKPVIVDSDESDFVTNTGHGNTLFYDTLSGRYFRSSTNAVDRAINNLNKSMLSDNFMTVNEFYNELEIPTIGAGSLIGWYVDKELADIFYSSDIDANGQPYVCIEYRSMPVPLYNYHYN